jgi:hypothetical protein
MGYSTRKHAHGSITEFWPDDTDTMIYIAADSYTSLAALRQRIEDKWPGSSEGRIVISSEYIHTDCIGYDRYDPGDYTKFITIEKIVPTNG